MSLRIYNTLARGKEEFVPRDAGRAGIYVCGPTVYNFIHVGNARTYLSFDTVVRYLRFIGYDDTYARNLTDVDDKIINRAAEEGIAPADVAEKYSQAFREDMTRLRTLPSDVEPKATEHIPEMVELTQGLIDRGVAYEVDGDVYFEIEKFPAYGKLSGRGLDDMRAGERVEIDPRKRNPMDFALWKAAKPGEPSWPSPWGDGRPGWHLECSVMSEKYLGQSFDIHGGAQDLIFPHHENEMAQAEAAGVAPFVRYWMHAGMLNFSGEKMAKSVGNIVLMRDLLDRHDANVVRMLMLSTHYRSPLEFNEDRLEEATEKLGRLRDVLKDTDDALSDAGSGGSDGGSPSPASDAAAAVEAVRAAFTDAMDDDFNAPLALAAVFELVQQINGALNAKSWGARRACASTRVRRARRTTTRRPRARTRRGSNRSACAGWPTVTRSSASGARDSARRSSRCGPSTRDRRASESHAARPSCRRQLRLNTLRRAGV